MPEAKQGTSRGARAARGLRSVWRRVRGRAARILWDEKGGLDDAAMPSGYAAPYRRGSRQVRNLWHIPF
jgi:hypothetical protein